jgi:hypothetical protein
MLRGIMPVVRILSFHLDDGNNARTESVGGTASRLRRCNLLVQPKSSLPLSCVDVEDDFLQAVCHETRSLKPVGTKQESLESMIRPVISRLPQMLTIQAVGHVSVWRR